MAGKSGTITERLSRSAGFYAAGAIICWSTVATAFKWALTCFTPAFLLFISTTSAIAALSLLLMAAGQRGVLFSIPRNVWYRAAFLGLINPFLYYLILFEAYSLLPAQVAQALNMVWPLLLVLLSIPVLGQKIRWLNIAAMLVSFTGALFVAMQGSPKTLFDGTFHITNPWGIALALGSSLLWAVYFLLNMKNKVSGPAGLLMNFLFAWVYIAAYLLVRFLLQKKGIHVAAGASTPFFTSGFSMRSLLSAVYVGVFEMAVPFVIWLKALKLAKNTAVVSSLIYIFPFLSLLLIHYVLGEPVFPSTLTGLVLIIAGVLLSQFSDSAKTYTFTRQ